jgi:hypothetical protein
MRHCSVVTTPFQPICARVPFRLIATNPHRNGENSYQHQPTKTMKNQIINRKAWVLGLFRGSVISACMLFAAGPLTCALNAAQDQTVNRTKTLDYEVTIDGLEAGCPEIDWPLTLTGTAQIVVIDSVRKGVHQILMHAIVHGIATDGAGNTFVFSYANNLRTSVDVSSGEYVVNFDTDNFTMASSAGHITVGFVGALIFDPIDDPVTGTFVDFEVDHAHGNVLCDPI